MKSMRCIGVYDVYDVYDDTVSKQVRIPVAFLQPTMTPQVCLWNRILSSNGDRVHSQSAHAHYGLREASSSCVYSPELRVCRPHRVLPRLLFSFTLISQAIELSLFKEVIDGGLTPIDRLDQAQ